MSKSTPLKAKKITESTPQSQQLSLFVASLGLTSDVELYLCGELIYIKIDMLLAILSVDVKWFLKNAETPLHYIVLNKAIYVNRYGMTKLIGQSVQPAALRLQDYLYDLFYHVETDGVVYRDELKSRDKLLELTDELHTYKTIIETSRATLEEAKESNDCLRNDYALVEQENANLLKQLSQKEDEISTLQEEIDSYKAIATKLTRYVRVKSANPPDEAFSDLVDIEEDLEDSPQISKDALVAKRLYTVMSKKAKVSTAVAKDKSIPCHSPPILKKPPIAKYYLMRSVNPTDGLNYTWSLSDVQPDNAHVTKSEEYLEQEDCDFSYSDVCYRSLMLTNEKKHMILLFLSLGSGEYDEPTINKLIEG